MKKIIYSRPDGGVSILHLNPEMFDPESRTRALLRSKGVDFKGDDEVFSFIMTKDVPADAANIRVVEDSAIPCDRSKRHELSDRDIK